MRAMHWIAGAVAAIAFVAAAGVGLAEKPPLDARVGGVLVGDQSMDAIYLTRDLNGDGDASDLNEAIVYYQDPNGYTNDVDTIFQSTDGRIFYGDASADGVFWLHDLNHDCDAADPGEFGVWFNNDNAGGFTLTAPNGVWQGDDGAVYIYNAGTTSTPVDAIYRTVDLNADGDANDDGEATLWMDVQNLMTSSAGFELVFMGNAAYWADSMGGGSDAVMRAKDEDGDGEIKADEFNVFIDESSGFGVGIFSALATDGTSLYVIDLSGTPQVLFRLTDLNDSGTIDDASEVEAVWDETHLPAGYGFSSTFGIAIGPNREIMMTSNGSDTGDTDNLVRLVDFNGDGDYLDDGETIIWATGNGDATFVERARSVEYILSSPGDINGDGVVDLADLSILLASYNLCEGDAGYIVAADLDGDGCVGLSDLSILLANYGATCP